MRSHELGASGKVVLALHNLKELHKVGMFAKDLGPQVHAVSINMRMARVGGLSEVIQKFNHWGVHNLVIDESFGVQDKGMILDIAAQHHEVKYITIDGRMGFTAMRRLAEAKNQYRATRSVKLIATTDLPEIPDEDVTATFMQTVPELVKNLSGQAQKAGLDGYYASLREAGCGPADFFYMASGVRLGLIEGDDKFRTATLEEARDFPQRPDLYVLGSAVTHFAEYDECLNAFGSVIEALTV